MLLASGRFVMDIWASLGVSFFGEIAVCVNGPTRSPPLRQCVIWISCSIRCIHMPESCLHKQRQRGWNDAWMALPETDNKKRGPKGKVFYVKSTCKSKQVAAPAPFQHMGKFVRLFWVAVSDRSVPSLGTGGLCPFVLVGVFGSIGSLIRYGSRVRRGTSTLVCMCLSICTSGERCREPRQSQT